MNGQYRQFSSISTPSSQGHLLLIILNLVLLACVSVFIYLNSVSLDELQDKQDSMASNVNDLKNKNLSLVEQDEHLKKLLAILKEDTIKNRSDITNVRINTSINNGLLKTINTNLAFIDKIKKDFGDFDTSGLDNLMEKLKTMSDTLYEKDNNVSLLDKITGYFTESSDEVRINKEIVEYENRFNKYKETITNDILDQLKNIFNIFNGNSNLVGIINGTITLDNDDISGLKSLSNKYSILKITTIIYHNIIYGLRKGLLKIKDDVNNSDITNTKKQGLYDKIDSISGNSTSNVTNIENAINAISLLLMPPILTNINEASIDSQITNIKNVINTYDNLLVMKTNISEKTNDIINKINKIIQSQ